MEVQTSRSIGTTSRKQPRLGTSWPSASAMSMLKTPPGRTSISARDTRPQARGMYHSLRCSGFVSASQTSRRGRVDEPFEDEIELRIDREVFAHGSDSFSLSCLTYSSNRSSRASHNRRRSVSQSSATLEPFGYDLVGPHPPPLLRPHQPAPFEHRQVLHERGELHVERCRQLADRGRSDRQLLQNSPPSRVGQGMKDVVGDRGWSHLDTTRSGWAA